ncbi:hypothetical protein IV203_008483 [Nitzschia inconspicua]|uniref:Uncharacterized protein n=1 Tax=Nitzschia inconspicua TaxID=303405 RepID=A0A9K3PM14_9STRA|nr:hypothetical protein IV203_008483 [Nitzschia inconspicua]
MSGSSNNKRPASGPPGMELSDDSSLDDSMGSRASKKSCGSSNCKPNKRVSWDQIHTREFTLVVGDHPMCQDGLPVSLGWDHADSSSMAMQTEATAYSMPPLPIRERQQSYAFPRRLSYEERRDRLLNVSNLTLDQIKNDEIDLVVRTLRESWEDAGDDVLGMAAVNEGDDGLMGCEGDPLAAMMGLVDTTTDTTRVAATCSTMILPGMSLDDEDDLGDISNFAWTDDE